MEYLSADVTRKISATKIQGNSWEELSDQVPEGFYLCAVFDQQLSEQEWAQKKQELAALPHFAKNAMPSSIKVMCVAIRKKEDFDPSLWKSACGWAIFYAVPYR